MTDAATRQLTRCRVAWLWNGAEMYGCWFPIRLEDTVREMTVQMMRRNPDVRAWVERR